MSAKTMPTQCHDIETLLPTYLDGELAAHDHLSFEHHMADCAACRDRVLSEGAYRARVRELLAAPPPPDLLAARVRQALDREDEQARSARRRVGRNWALPTASVFAAAAALTLFLVSESRTPSPSVADHTAEHRMAGDRTVSLALSPSGLGQRSGNLGNWSPRRVEFDVSRNDGRRHEVWLQLMRCRELDLRRDERLPEVSGDDVWVGRRDRLNTVTVGRSNGTCFVFTSDMEADELLSGVMRLGLTR
jgi:hypothetical protein